MEQVAWAKGMITDYKPSTNEHTVVYDINTPDESWEEINLTCVFCWSCRLCRHAALLPGTLCPYMRTSRSPAAGLVTNPVRHGLQRVTGKRSQYIFRAPHRSA